MKLSPNDNIVVVCNCTNYADKRLFGSFVTHASSLNSLRADVRLILIGCLSRFRSQHPEYKHSKFEYVIAPKVLISSPKIENSAYYLPKFRLTL